MATDKPPSRRQQLVSAAGGRPPTTPLSRARERARPATKKEIAVELERLRAVFGYEEEAWETAVPLYLEMFEDLPPDLLHEAVVEYIRGGNSDTRFPKPNQIRASIVDRVRLRKENLADQERIARAGDDWPKWLEETWGPLPAGRNRRNQALAAKAQKDEESRTRLYEVGALVLEHGYDHTTAWNRWADGERPSHPTAFEQEDAERAAAFARLPPVEYVELCANQARAHLGRFINRATAIAREETAPQSAPPAPKREPIYPDKRGIDELLANLGVRATEQEPPP